MIPVSLPRRALPAWGLIPAHTNAMRKWVRIALVLVGVAPAVVVVWLVWRDREPVYQGRPLIVWIKEGMPGGPSRDKAIDAVLAAGTNGFPYYVKWLETAHDPRLKIKIV